MHAVPKTLETWVDCNDVGRLHHWRYERCENGKHHWACARCPVRTFVACGENAPKAFLRRTLVS